MLGLLLLPVLVVKAMLVSPRTARRHPLSDELRTLLHEGWAVSRFDVHLEPLSVAVDVERDGDRRELRSGELAFAVYSLQAIPSARARGTREGVPELTARP